MIVVMWESWNVRTQACAAFKTSAENAGSTGFIMGKLRYKLVRKK
jgi:hypothetical protein